jgi:hypothetical protein
MLISESLRPVFLGMGLSWRKWCCREEGMLRGDAKVDNYDSALPQDSAPHHYCTGVMELESSYR